MGEGLKLGQAEAEWKFPTNVGSELKPDGSFTGSYRITNENDPGKVTVPKEQLKSEVPLTELSSGDLIRKREGLVQEYEFYSDKISNWKSQEDGDLNNLQRQMDIRHDKINDINRVIEEKGLETELPTHGPQ